MPDKNEIIWVKRIWLHPNLNPNKGQHGDCIEIYGWVTFNKEHGWLSIAQADNCSWAREMSTGKMVFHRAHMMTQFDWEMLPSKKAAISYCSALKNRIKLKEDKSGKPLDVEWICSRTREVPEDQEKWNKK